MNYSIKHRRKPFFLIAIVLLFVVSAIVMWLWNAILPTVLGVTTITYWQAMGILVLSKILFGGFGGCKKRHHHMENKRKFLHRMKNMTPEERARFKELWKQKYRKERYCKH